MTKSALILVDIQNDYFSGGRWSLDGMEAAAANAARLLAAARRSGTLVLHIRHEMDRPDAPFFAPGSEGAEINAVVAPEGDEPVLLKHRPNSFLGTDLKTRLDDAGADAVTICGAMSQMCVDATARAAADFGYRVTVAADACAAKAVSHGGVEAPAAMVHTAIMGALAAAYGDVTTTEAALGALADEPA
ncbi:MAG: isochorismatase family protein [Pseudomonadota bacterium]